MSLIQITANSKLIITSKLISFNDYSFIMIAVYVGWFLSVINQRQVIKLIVVFLVDDILNTDNLSFNLKNHIALLLVSWVCVLYIEDLSNIFGKHEWFFSVSDEFEVNGSHTVLVDIYSTWGSDPLALK